MTDREHKRDNERIPVPSMHGEVKVFQPMTILDISHGGAQIETPFPLQLDSLHDFRLSLGDRSIVVKGRIAHSQIGDARGGDSDLSDGRRVHRAVRARADRDQRLRRPP